MISKHTQESFIEKAKLVHGKYYDYSETIFKNVASDIEIICPVHGKFKQRASHHIQGSGCKPCGISNGNTRKITSENFIKRCVEKHGGFYDYSKTIFLGMKKKICVICPVHGEFTQLASYHSAGGGCKPCAIDSSSIDSEKAIVGFNKVHNNLYDYSLVNYVRNNIPIRIICNVHGLFEQTPKDHLRGRGCGACGREDNTFYNTFEKWEKRGKTSKHFKTFSFYILILSNENERFYKIGITYTDMYRRYNKNTLPYNFEVVHIISDFENAEKIFNIEQSSKKILSNNRYIPKIYFAGHSECFDTSIDISDLIAKISKQ